LPPPVTVSSPKAKTRRIVRALEKALGVPRQAGSLPPPLDMLVATVLSQNTNDKNSHRAYTSLRQKFPRWELVAASSPGTIRSAIRAGGMANQKAPRILNILNEVRKRYGRFDLSTLTLRSNEEIIAELTDLNGVGPKTAACVLLFSLGRDVFPVDTHVHRICSRLGLSPYPGSPEKTFDTMRRLIPRGKGYSFHTNLIRFGRTICRSNRPVCNECPVYAECLYPGKRSVMRKRSKSSADHNFMLLDNVAST